LYALFVQDPCKEEIMIEMFRVFATPTETPDGGSHLRLHVELNADVFADLTDEETRTLLKTSGNAILTMVDTITIDRDEEFVK
jgi:hypothetical protein